MIDKSRQSTSICEAFCALRVVITRLCAEGKPGSIPNRYDADALDSERQKVEEARGTSRRGDRELEVAQSERGARGFFVAQSVLDAASLMADVKANYERLKDVVTITIFEHEGEKYFEYVQNKYRDGVGFSHFAPSQDNVDYPDALKHL